ncbi:hypothetical protein CAC42_8190 [Sphaceloma murrayae]|uniref:Uncharacterized protein n=1 Tax=Sphaceloma murrayae TaxID=2082308 RepID=A0A2K1QJX1_9PEZI|nr:hypothetical protein CAC42_8190 [Sphaceloma murrayae]
MSTIHPTPRDASSELAMILINRTAEPTVAKRFLANALAVHQITALHILGHSAPGLQSLKTEAYTLAGKQSRNLSVTIHELDNPDHDSELLTRKVSEIATSGPLHGTLLVSTNTSSDDSSPSLLDQDSAALHRLLATSITTLHGIARATIPHTSNNSPGPTAHGPFFAVHNPASSPLGTRFQDLVLSDLRLAAPHISIGHAEAVLPAPVEKIDEKLTGRLGAMAIQIPGTEGVGDDDVGDGEEGSPTKLWSAWAALEEG